MTGSQMFGFALLCSPFVVFLWLAAQVIGWRVLSALVVCSAGLFLVLFFALGFLAGTMTL